MPVHLHSALVKCCFFSHIICIFSVKYFSLVNQPLADIHISVLWKCYLRLGFFHIKRKRNHPSIYTKCSAHLWKCIISHQSSQRNTQFPSLSNRHPDQPVGGASAETECFHQQTRPILQWAKPETVRRVQTPVIIVLSPFYPCLTTCRGRVKPLQNLLLCKYERKRKFLQIWKKKEIKL